MKKINFDGILHFIGFLLVIGFFISVFILLPSYIISKDNHTNIIDDSSYQLYNYCKDKGYDVEYYNIDYKIYSFKFNILSPFSEASSEAKIDCNNNIINVTFITNTVFEESKDKWGDYDYHSYKELIIQDR